MESDAILGWLDGLSSEERDYLTLYHQCGLVIDHDSRLFGGTRTMPLPARSAQSAGRPGAAAAIGGERNEAPEFETLKEAFCRRFGCATEDFNREIFMRTVYPVARWWARCGGYRSDRFVLDRALVAYCGTLKSLKEIDGELKEYASYRENGKFLRRTFRVRLSGRRLRRLAAECFG